jgi:hypothetical protein
VAYGIRSYNAAARRKDAAALCPRRLQNQYDRGRVRLHGRLRGADAGRGAGSSGQPAERRRRGCRPTPPAASGMRSVLSPGRPVACSRTPRAGLRSRMPRPGGGVCPRPFRTPRSTSQVHPIPGSTGTPCLSPPLSRHSLNRLPTFGEDDHVHVVETPKGSPNTYAFSVVRGIPVQDDPAGGHQLPVRLRHDPLDQGRRRRPARPPPG